MKSTVPAGTGRRDPPLEARADVRLLPGVPQGGLGGQRLPRARPRRDRRRPGLRVGGRRGRGALRAARRRSGPHRRRLGRDDQARLERLPGDQDLLHQRDRERLRGGRRRCRPRSRAGWASTSASAPSSCRRGSAIGGSCFPKDTQALKQLAGNTGYHFQLLNSVIEVNELQKRRVIVEADQAPRFARRPGVWRCSASPSSRTPTTCARHRASSSRRA